LPVNGFYDDLDRTVCDTYDIDDREAVQAEHNDEGSSMLVASLPAGCERQTGWRGHEPRSGTDTPLKCGEPWAVLRTWREDYAVAATRCRALSQWIQSVTDGPGCGEVSTARSNARSTTDHGSESAPAAEQATDGKLTWLYCYRDRSGKPAGMTGPDLHRPRAEIQPEGGRVRRRPPCEGDHLHHRKTSDPILPKAAQPTTAVSRDFLLMVAMRSDFKGHKQAGCKVQNDDQHRPQPNCWRKYAAELVAVLADSTFTEPVHPGR
jgi:hypothetical protein